MTSRSFDSSRRHLLAAVGCTTLLAACGGGSDEVVVTVPAVAPTLIISSSAGALAGGAFTVRFEFSAPVAAFPSGSLPFALQGGRQLAGSFKALSATVFTVGIEPNAQSNGNVLLSVPAGAFADATGKASNTVAYTLTQAYDTATCRHGHRHPRRRHRTLHGQHQLQPRRGRQLHPCRPAGDRCHRVGVDQVVGHGLHRAADPTRWLNGAEAGHRGAVAGLGTAVASGVANSRGWAFGFWYRT